MPMMATSEHEYDGDTGGCFVTRLHVYASHTGERHEMAAHIPQLREMVVGVTIHYGQRGIVVNG